MSFLNDLLDVSLLFDLREGFLDVRRHYDMVQLLYLATIEDLQDIVLARRETVAHEHQFLQVFGVASD